MSTFSHGSNHPIYGIERYDCANHRKKIVLPLIAFQFWCEIRSNPELWDFIVISRQIQGGFGITLWSSSFLPRPQIHSATFNLTDSMISLPFLNGEKNRNNWLNHPTPQSRGSSSPICALFKNPQIPNLGLAHFSILRTQKRERVGTRAIYFSSAQKKWRKCRGKLFGNVTQIQQSFKASTSCWKLWGSRFLVPRALARKTCWHIGTFGKRLARNNERINPQIGEDQPIFLLRKIFQSQFGSERKTRLAIFRTHALL